MEKAISCFRLHIDRSHPDLKNLTITLEPPPFDDASNNSFRTRRHIDRLSDTYLLRRPSREAVPPSHPSLSDVGQELKSSIPIEKEGSAMLSFQVNINVIGHEHL